MRPTRGAVKINCDAAWNSLTGEGGIGVIARDHEGRVLGGAHSSERSASIVTIEASAVYEGVKLATENRWESVVIESDTKVVIDNVIVTVKFWEIETIVQNSLHLGDMIRNLSWS